MKYFTVAFFLMSFSIFSQEMTISKLDAIIKKSSNVLDSKGARWNISINNIPLVIIADSLHNRMRIISPIAEVSKLNEELKTASLIANFHTALDIKYAITNDVLWSVFTHPLMELSEKQVIDAISQVYYGHVNFGTTFSSTSLIFPSNKNQIKEEKKVSDKEEKIIKKI